MKTNVAGEHEKCRICGSESLVKVGEFCEKIISDVNADLQRFHEIDSRNDLMICRDCHRVHLVMDYKTDHPLVPNRTIGTHTLAEIAYWVSHGVSTSKLAAEVQRVFNISTETMSYNLKDLGGLILQPFIDCLEKQLKQEPIVIADETGFSILEAQGKGHQKKGTKAEELRTKNYITGLATPSDSNHPIVLFKPMAGRGVDCLNRVITPDYHFNLLVTDGYSAYNALLKADHPNADHQICLIHWRRLVLEAGVPQYIEKDFASLSERNKRRFIKKHIKEKSPFPQLIEVLDAIQKIYQYRADNQLHPEHVTVNLEQQRKLMDSIDVLINGMSVNRVSQAKSGSYQSNNKSDRVGSACAYYKNNREALRTFLKDSSFPCDSNLIESNIRTIAIIRRNIFFKQNMEYTTALLNIVSMFSTLKANGIEDPVNWLRDYCRAVYLHIVETAWTEALADGVDPAKKLVTYNVKERLKDFNATPFLPWVVDN